MKSLFTILLFTITSFCYAADYYISPLGNDASGSGTLLSPWRSLYKATTTVTTSGNTINIIAGSYPETHQITLAVGVNILGAGSSVVTITSTVTSFQSPMILLSSVEGTSGNQIISGIKIDGQSLATSWGIYVEGRSNVSINNCVVTNFGDRGVIFASTSGFEEQPPAVYATGNSFYNNTVTNCAAFYGPYGTGCLNIGGQQNMLVYSNTIIQNQRPIGENGWCIKHFQGGYWKNMKMYGNTITKIPWTGDYGSDLGWNFAIESYHHFGLEFYNNTVTGGSLDLNYVSKGAYSYGAWIHNNSFSLGVLSASYHDAIHLEFSITDAIIEDNSVNKMAGGVVFATRALDSINNVTIQKNLMSNIGRTQGNGNNGVGIGTYSEGTNDYTIYKLNIYNNTIVAATGFAPFEGIHINAVDNGHAGSISNVNIKNNIVQGFWESWLRINNGSFCNNLNVTYNNLYLNATSNAPYITGGSPVNYTSSPNLLASNPLFVDAAGGNYHVTALSPCINAGINVGLPFFGTAPTIGYWQFGTPPPPVGTEFRVNKKVIVTN